MGLDMERTPLDFDDLLAKLSEIDKWLASLGINTHTRFRRYRDNIQEMMNQKDDAPAATIHAKIAAQGRLTEILASYVEGMEVADTLSTLRNAGTLIPVDVLKKAVGGPTDASKEDDGSNTGRNFMFELVMAAAMASGG